MEKILTIKEAADFLNVSEMSLRRWTNTDKLKCYRLEGKNERRFTRRELENFLPENCAAAGAEKSTGLKG